MLRQPAEGVYAEDTTMVTGKEEVLEPAQVQPMDIEMMKREWSREPTRQESMAGVPTPGMPMYQTKQSLKGTYRDRRIRGTRRTTQRRTQTSSPQ